MHANLIAFSLFTVATPGPNNAMLVASGARMASAGRCLVRWACVSVLN